MRKKKHRKQKEYSSFLGVRDKRVYTLTTAQYVVGFFISITFSMIFGPLFERYAPGYLTAAANAISVIKDLDSEKVAKNFKAELHKPIATKTITLDPYQKLRNEVRELNKSSSTNS